VRPGDGEAYGEREVERPVRQAPNSAAPAYPDILRQAGVEGEALVSFVVDTSGRVEVGSFKVIRSSHELFAAAVKNALPRMRFIPAEVGSDKVRQLVQQPYSFAILK
jgi:protein TonB